MLEYTSGDILRTDAEAVINTVNCVGVMGRGIALQFKKTYPANFKAYAAACKHHQVQPGRMFVFETGELTNPRYVINFPTKRHWRGNSRMEDIESGLAALVEVIEARGIRSVAIPPLGSGLGGLEWLRVRNRIETAMQSLPDVRVVVYEPRGAPTSENMVRNPVVPKMTPGRAALVALMHRYLAGLLDPFVSLLEVHKLMYFLQEAGEPLRLRYQKAHYGPYAENLKHVLNTIEGHLVSGYADGGDMPTKPLTLIDGAREGAEEFLHSKTATHERLERVGRLVNGFESPAGMELLSTVHWVVVHEGAKNEAAVIAGVRDWSLRKQQFSERQIGIALRVLSEHKWVDCALDSH